MPVLVEQYVTVRDVEDAKKAAELWRFSPKAFKTYYNVRDPQKIQNEADCEIPLEKVYEDWAIGADPQVHIKKINDLLQSGVSIVSIHCAQPDQRRIIRVLRQGSTAEAEIGRDKWGTDGRGGVEAGKVVNLPEGVPLGRDLTRDISHGIDQGALR